MVEKRERYEHLYIAFNPDETVRGAHLSVVTEIYDDEDGVWKSTKERTLPLSVSEEADCYGTLKDLLGETYALVLTDRENTRNQNTFLNTELETVQGELQNLNTVYDRLKAASEVLAKEYAKIRDELASIKLAQQEKTE